MSEPTDQQQQTIRRFTQWINPAEEDLWSKVVDLRARLDLLALAGANSNPDKQLILAQCREKLDLAEACLAAPGKFILAPLKKNYRSFWSFVHRVDEELLLLIPDEQLLTDAVDTKNAFANNIANPAQQQEWIGTAGGTPGKLLESISNIENALKATPTTAISPCDRLVVRDALRMVNEQVDRTFWMLSLNTSVSVISGIMMGAIPLLMFFMAYGWSRFSGSHCDFYPADKSFFLAGLCFLGVLGAYLSNLVTKEDFLFIRGPYWRFMLFHVVAKPVLGATSAAFIYLLERSKLIFSLDWPSEPKAQLAPTLDKLKNQMAAIDGQIDHYAQAIAPQVHALNSQIADLYTLLDHYSAVLPSMADNGLIHIQLPSLAAASAAYAVLAIAAGFSGDKLLRSMIERVLKRLEATAEKSSPN